MLTYSFSVSGLNLVHPPCGCNSFRNACAPLQLRGALDRSPRPNSEASYANATYDSERREDRWEPHIILPPPESLASSWRPLTPGGASNFPDAQFHLLITLPHGVPGFLFKGFRPTSPVHSHLPYPSTSEFPPGRDLIGETERRRQTVPSQFGLDNHNNHELFVGKFTISLTSHSISELR